MTRYRRHVLLAWPWIIALTASPMVGHAQDTSVEERARARVVAGEQAWQRKDYAAAFEAYREAYTLVRNPKLHYNLGLALTELGRDADAANELEAFLRDSPDAPEAAREHARALIAAREPHLARLEVSTGLSVSVEIAIDGSAIGPAPVDWYVWPGDHEITVSARGHRDSTREVSVAAGDRLPVRLDPSPVDLTVPATQTFREAPLAPVRREHEHRSILSRWWFWTIVGGAVVAGSVGLYFATTGSDCPDGSGTSLGSVCPFSD